MGGPRVGVAVDEVEGSVVGVAGDWLGVVVGFGGRRCRWAAVEESGLGE